MCLIASYLISLSQFCYGDDGLDPIGMEKDDMPINLAHLLDHVCTSYKTDSTPLLPHEMVSMTDAILSTERTKYFYPPYSPLGLAKGADDENVSRGLMTTL